MKSKPLTAARPSSATIYLILILRSILIILAIIGVGVKATNTPVGDFETKKFEQEKEESKKVIDDNPADVATEFSNKLDGYIKTMEQIKEKLFKENGYKPVPQVNEAMKVWTGLTSIKVDFSKSIKKCNGDEPCVKDEIKKIVKVISPLIEKYNL